MSLIPHPLFTKFVLLVSAAVLALAVTPFYGQSTAGGSDQVDANPYIIDLTGKFHVIPLLTVGDEMIQLNGPLDSLTAGSDMFAMMSVQAHSLTHADFVESGQIVLVRGPLTNPTTTRYFPFVSR